MMKSIVVFYDDEKSPYSNEKAFDSKSAKELSLLWANSLDSAGIVTIKAQPSVSSLLEQICIAGKDNQADYIVFAFADVPFYNKKLSQKMIENHEKYHSEYTFADGYSLGFAPEVIDLGTLNILKTLSQKEYSDEGQKPVTKSFIFDLLKKDINSFEIETVLAKNDWRLLRLDFNCELKENFLSCKALFNACKNENIDVLNCEPEEINSIAEKTPGVLKTVPGFYNIQIADYFSKQCMYSPYICSYEHMYKCSCVQATKVMAKADFESLVKRIAEYSENAVISLSLWGEAFKHPDLLSFIKTILQYKGLSVFIETCTTQVSDAFVTELKNIVESAQPRSGRWAPVMIAVAVDGTSNQMYQKIHGDEGTLENVMEVINKLESAIPGDVYPQFMRMNVNESELESFFRFWNEKDSPSKGKFIIQKYDDYVGLLPEEKAADLSPIQRNVCWHLRRDMNILTNGDVILCKEYVLENVIGNVFKEDLQSVWTKMDEVLLNHMGKKYECKCEKCDEFYTYNF